MDVALLMADLTFGANKPAFIFINDDKIVRMTPTDLTANAPAAWNGEDRTSIFSAPHKRSVAVCTQGYMSMLYSDKRVGFNPDINNDQPICNLFSSERIAWEERPLSWPTGSLAFSAPTTWLPLGCLLAQAEAPSAPP